MKAWNRRLTLGLFLFYLVVLAWIILLKLAFSIQSLDRFRGINLVPFAGSALANGKLDWTEIVNNILIFIPFGIYLSMLKGSWPVLLKLVPIFCASLAFEGLQYVLAVGASDITDLIGNTLGGGIGIGLYRFLLLLLRDRSKTNRAFQIAALSGTVLATAFLALLLAMN